MPTTPFLNQYIEEGTWQINMASEVYDASNNKWVFQYILHNAIQRPNGYQFVLDAATEPVELFAVYEMEAAALTTPWSGAYPQGTTVTITLDGSAYPNRVVGATVYQMIGWRVSKDGGVTYTNYSASQSIIVTVDSPDTRVIADYQETVATISIDVHSGGNGTVSPEGHADVTIGVPYDLDASFNPTPSSGFVFDHWELSSRGVITSPFTFATTDDGAILTAYFAAVGQQVTVTVAAVNGTTDKGTGDNMQLTVGDTITAQANPGYKFERWLLGTSEYSRNATIVITLAMDGQTLTAEFTSTPTPSIILPITLGLLAVGVGVGSS